MSVLGTHLCQYTCWCCCERLHLASVTFFFEESMHLPISWWVIYNALAHPTECSAVFWRLCPSLRIHLTLPQAILFFLTLDKIKSSKGKRFPMWKRRNKKLKGIKTDEFKNCFEQWKKSFNRCIAFKWGALWMWLKFKHIRINAQFFINKFWFYGVPPHMSRNNDIRREESTAS